MRVFFLFKVNFKKAYDFIIRPFMDYMLQRFSFDDKWMTWICAFVFRVASLCW